MGLRDEFESVWFGLTICKTSQRRISATYSNLENHPRLIRAREVKPTSKIRLNPKSGLPSVTDGLPPKAVAGDDKCDEGEANICFSP